MHVGFSVTLNFCVLLSSLKVLPRELFFVFIPLSAILAIAFFTANKSVNLFEFEDLYYRLAGKSQDQ